MKSTRIALVIAAVAGTAAVATGCAAGGGAETLQIQPNFATGTSGDVQALNMVVVVDPATGAAQVTGTVVNNGDDPATLSGVTVDGKSVSVAAGGLALAPHAALNLAAPSGPNLVLADSGSVAGGLSPVALSFASGATISVSAETEANTGIYQQFQPSSAGSASSPTPTPSSSSSSKPTSPSSSSSSSGSKSTSSSTPSSPASSSSSSASS